MYNKANPSEITPFTVVSSSNSPIDCGSAQHILRITKNNPDTWWGQPFAWYLPSDPNNKIVNDGTLYGSNDFYVQLNGDGSMQSPYEARYENISATPPRTDANSNGQVSCRSWPTDALFPPNSQNTLPWTISNPDGAWTTTTTGDPLNGLIWNTYAEQASGCGGASSCLAIETWKFEYVTCNTTGCYYGGLYEIDYSDFGSSGTLLINGGNHCKQCGW